MPTTTQRIRAICLAGAALSLSASAAELAVYQGGLQVSQGSNRAQTYSWGVEYRHPISDHFSGSLIYLNEGHVPDHHRDGTGAQLWWRSGQADVGPVFEVGAGPYRFFDTTAAGNGAGFADAHGWGVLASAAANWYFESGWFASLRVNRVQARHSYNSTALIAGLGYRFGSETKPRDAAPEGLYDWRDGRWEIDGALGKTVVNSFHSEHAFAKSADLRLKLTDHLTGSVSFINEGDARLERRWGGAAQLWLDDQLTERFSVGAGMGPYVAIDKYHHPGEKSAPDVSLLVSATAAYAFTPRWVTRAIWHRVATGYSRDADIFMLAMGYRF
ncbi:hypothetical protein PTE30175_03397 [Pandoraea terrae]|uniref:Uncharacterized protein n=1 Tax=Pandoraea terrae TaxID=1537710 RepID=A0A5E4WU57_9BURK|nr:hypothetical protein [Pandoraea terrae]VVE27803.1 hypothetical protein PTE30175_03397 [Pandoraea terrae]